MSKELFDARIALLEEMLEAVRTNVYALSFAFEDVPRLGPREAGFAVALDIVRQWKAIENGRIERREEPVALPRDEAGIGP